MRLTTIVGLLAALWAMAGPAAAQPARADWANLARYRAENASTPPPAPGEARVVFLGASIVEFWKRDDPAFFTAHAIVDRGIAGQTTDQILLRLRQDVIALKPAVLVILAGTNDVAGNNGPMTPEQTRDNLASMAELARAHGIKVVICAITPAGVIPWAPTVAAPAGIAAANALTKAYAAREGFTWLDFAPAVGTAEGAMRPGLSRDGVHPTPQGYALMEPPLLAAIRRALGSR
jgi:lysophospholipase L1-like esterase